MQPLSSILSRLLKITKKYTKIANIKTKQRTMLSIILKELFNWNKYMQGIYKKKKHD